MSGDRTPDRTLLITCGWIGIFGSFALVAGNIVGSLVVPGHNWVADTVSNLAAGKYEDIQDFALYGYAAALIACAIGAANAHPGGQRWTLGIFCLAFLACLIVVIGARNEYGDHDRNGIVVHIYLAYAMGVLFMVTPLLMARGAEKRVAWFRRLSWTAGGIWIIGAPPYLFIPTSIDGAWERALGLVAVIWTIALAWSLIRLGRAIPP